jgi:4'-phosphopantetheinyl transferase EntD
LLEFKISPTPQTLKDKAFEALEQIKKKHYLQELKQHRLQKVLAIGLAFCGKEMDLAYENILLM